MMNTCRTHKFFGNALQYAEQHHADVVSWSKNLNPPETFRQMSVDEFLRYYCWVIYVSGFKVKTLSLYFKKLRVAFKNFDIERLNRMQSVDEVLRIFKNSQKANAFLRGAKLIYKEGYPEFQKRALENWQKTLQELPHINSVSAKHLARDVGLADASPNDMWMTRVAKLLKAANVEELTEFLAKEFQLNRATVNVVISLFCTDEGWYYFDTDDLKHFVQTL